MADFYEGSKIIKYIQTLSLDRHLIQLVFFFAISIKGEPVLQFYKLQSIFPVDLLFLFLFPFFPFINCHEFLRLLHL